MLNSNEFNYSLMIPEDTQSYHHHTGLILNKDFIKIQNNDNINSQYILFSLNGIGCISEEITNQTGIVIGTSQICLEINSEITD